MAGKADADPLEDMSAVVARLLRTDPRDRTRYLQTVIGPKTSNALILDLRAELVTILNNRRIWPHGCPGAGDQIAFDGEE